MPRTLPDEVVAAVGPIRQTGDGWSARCPAHDDTNPSLSLTVNPDGRTLVHCHAGCDQTTVLAALDLDPGVLNGDDPGEWTPRGPAVAVYDYRDEDGRLLSQVCRTADKQFVQRRPDPSKPHGWAWNLQGVRRVLFRLPELIAARDTGQTVYITEGEKDVLALVHHGKVATCNLGGAGKWRDEYAAYFVDLDVIVCADKDEPGQAHARTVAASLNGVARRVWIVEAADPYKDIAEQLGAGIPVDGVTVTRNPNDPPRPDLAEDFLDFMAGEDPGYDWLIPGLLARGDRLMVTGFEGIGKTMWLRQMAVAMAAGVDPVTFSRVAPLRVLTLDCENNRSMSRIKYRPIWQRAIRDGQPVAPGAFYIKHREEGVNLAEPDGAAWLMERVVAYRPDVLILGPLYRLHVGNPNDEETARALTGAIDAARLRGNCAVILEGHSGHGDQGQRSVRPVGSSLYLRWPEFGYGVKPADGVPDPLAPDALKVQPWRGPRDERAWPTRLRRGGDGNWPWVEDYPTGLRAV